MYEIELRTLIDDFGGIKKKLDNLAKPVELGEREVTVFFCNPHQRDFDLRLKINKNRYFLSFKEGSHKTARKEYESDISNPHAVYDLLLKSGFRIKLIVPRVKYTYEYEKFEILLNKIIGLGVGVEVETTVEERGKVDKIKGEIRDFMNSKLGLTRLIDTKEMERMNRKYGKKMNFENVSVKDMLDYVEGSRETLDLF